MSDLREALNPDLIGGAPDGKMTLPKPAFESVHAAARRFLALTETGPDYEAACWALVDSHAVDAITEIGGLTLGDVILAVDAALADYLTEEDR